MEWRVNVTLALVLHYPNYRQFSSVADKAKRRISDGTDSERMAFHGLAWISFLVRVQVMEILLLVGVQI